MPPDRHQLDHGPRHSAGAFVMPDTGVMAVQMHWGSDWVGQASGVFPDIDKACESLRSSVRRSLRHLSPQWRGILLQRSCAELRDRMGTEGRKAMDEGKRWRADSGPCWVSLRPWRSS